MLIFLQKPLISYCQLPQGSVSQWKLKYFVFFELFLIKSWWLSNDFEIIVSVFHKCQEIIAILHAFKSFLNQLDTQWKYKNVSLALSSWSMRGVVYYQVEYLIGIWTWVFEWMVAWGHQMSLLKLTIWMNGRNYFRGRVRVSVWGSKEENQHT